MLRGDQQNPPYSLPSLPPPSLLTPSPSADMRRPTSPVYPGLNGVMSLHQPLHLCPSTPLPLPTLASFQAGLLVSTFASTSHSASHHQNRTCLVAQWLRLHTFNAEGGGLIPDWGAEIPCAVQRGQKLYKQTNNNNKKNPARMIF